MAAHERKALPATLSDAARDAISSQQVAEETSLADDLRWPSPPDRRPVLDLPRTPPRPPPVVRDSSTYFEALKGRNGANEGTTSPSDGADVRWFYSKKALDDGQAAALVPATEAALKGDWLRFGTVDSAALEAAYRQQEEKLLSTWWREFAEVSIGPQLRDKERLERGAAASTPGSPQGPPQKARNVKTAPSPTPARTRLQDDAESSPKKTPLSSSKPTTPAPVPGPETVVISSGPEPPSPAKEPANTEPQLSFLSKVSAYLPSFRSSPGPSLQSPSKAQTAEEPLEKASSGETGPVESSVKSTGANNETGDIFEEDNAGRGPGTETGAAFLQATIGDVAAVSADTSTLESPGVPKPQLPGGVRNASDSAPLADVTEAAELDAGEKDGKPAMSEGDDSLEVGIQVKGGLFEGFLETRKLAPIFWKAGHQRILRGSWFAQPRKTRDWLPLREDIAEQLEIAYRGQVWHRRSFLPNGMYAHRVNIAGPSLGLYALFTGEDDTWEAWLGVDGSGVISRMFSAGHPTTRLRRGFKDEGLAQGQEEARQRREELQDDRKAEVPVKHLVFMVHGIGQRLERANIVDDARRFQAVSDAMLDQFLTPHQRASQRVLFIPCQWRKILQLGGEMIIDDITMEGIRGIRQIVNATVLDVLYYMSPVYCQDIVNSVCRSLNRQYNRFRRRNPDFDGQVHIFGHSLGSVLSYDILCHQPKPFLAERQGRPREPAATGKAAESVGEALARIPEASAGDPSETSADVAGKSFVPVEERRGTEKAEELSESSGTFNAKGVERRDESAEMRGTVATGSETGAGVSEELAEVSEGSAEGRRGTVGVSGRVSEFDAVKQQAETGRKGEDIEREKGAHGSERREEGKVGTSEPAVGYRIDGSERVQTSGRGSDGSGPTEESESRRAGMEREPTAEKLREDGTSHEGTERAQRPNSAGTSEEKGPGVQNLKRDGKGSVEDGGRKGTLVETESEPGTRGQQSGGARLGLRDERREATGRSEGSQRAGSQRNEGDESGNGQGGSLTGNVAPPEGSANSEVAALRAEVARLKEQLRRFEGFGAAPGAGTVSSFGPSNGAREPVGAETASSLGPSDETRGPLSTKRSLAGELDAVGELSEGRASADVHSQPEGTGGETRRVLQRVSGEQGAGDVSGTDGDVSRTSGDVSGTGGDVSGTGGDVSGTGDDISRTNGDISRAGGDVSGAACDVSDDPSGSEPGPNRPHLLSSPSVDIRIDDLKSTLKADVLRKRGPHAFIHYPRLAFEVDTFFAVGSPLGMFLALRNIEFGSATRGENMDVSRLEESMPAAAHMINIFHPYDPVAYRIEPLVSKDFVSRRPVFIPYHRGGQRLHIGMQQLRDDLSARSRAFRHDVISSLSSMKTRIASTFGGADQGGSEEDAEGGESDVNPHTAMVMERVTGSKHGRIDFMLQDATFEHPYISALSSHTAYWRDEDTALFVTRHLYRNVPEAPPGAESPEQPSPSEVGETDGVVMEDGNPTEEPDGKELPGSASRSGLRSRQSSSGGLKRSLSAGDQLGEEEVPRLSALGSFLWGRPGFEGLGSKPSMEGPRSQFDTWIADDETGLFYMPGGATTPLKPSGTAGSKGEEVSEPEGEEPKSAG